MKQKIFQYLVWLLIIIILGGCAVGTTNQIASSDIPENFPNQLGMQVQNDQESLDSPTSEPVPSLTMETVLNPDIYGTILFWGNYDGYTSWAFYSLDPVSLEVDRISEQVKSNLPLENPFDVSFSGKFLVAKVPQPSLLSIENGTTFEIPSASGYPSCLSFHPNQDKLAYIDDGIKTLDIPTNEVTKLSDIGCYSLSWTPLGDSLLCITNIESQGDIYIFSLVDLTFKRITSVDTNQFGGVQWSSNGSQIGFIVKGGIGGNLDPSELFVANITERRGVIENISKEFLPVGSRVVDFSWSPNSARMAITYEVDPGKSKVSLLVINLENMENEFQSLQSRPHYPFWSPDGSVLGYKMNSRDGDVIALLSVDDNFEVIKFIQLENDVIAPLWISD